MDGAHSAASLDKQHPFEESIGVPLIIRDPRLKRRSGMILEDPLATADLYPTFLGLAGLEPREEKSGMDAAPLVRGELAALSREGVLLEFVHELRPDPHLYLYHDLYWRGFRTRHFKYTVLGDAREGGRPWPFYDLSDDPYEMHNLIGTPASRKFITHHHRLLRERMIATRDHYVLATAFGMPGLNLW